MATRTTSTRHSTRTCASPPLWRMCSARRRSTSHGRRCCASLVSFGPRDLSRSRLRFLRVLFKSRRVELAMFMFFLRCEGPAILKRREIVLWMFLGSRFGSRFCDLPGCDSNRGCDSAICDLKLLFSRRVSSAGLRFRAAGASGFQIAAIRDCDFTDTKVSPPPACSS